MPAQERLPAEQNRPPSSGILSPRDVVGYAPSEHASWDAQELAGEIDARRREFEDPQGKTTLLDVYDYNADHARLTATNILEAAKKEGRDIDHLTQEERDLLVQSHMRATYLENLEKSIAATMRLYDMYEEAKTMGMKPLPEEEKTVQGNLVSLTTLASDRVRLARTLALEKDTAHRGTLAQQVLELDRKIGDTIASTDDRSLLRRWIEGKNPSGANPEGVLPVMSVLANMFDRRYRELSAEQMELARSGTQEYVRATEERIEHAKQRVVDIYRQRFPSDERMTFERLPAALRRELFDEVDRLEGKPQGTLAFQIEIDGKLLERAKNQPFKKLFDDLDEEKRRDLAWFARLTKTMGEYHIGRSKLTSIRHHFDQSYAFSGNIERRSEQRGDKKTVESWDEQLLLQEREGLKDIRMHIDEVEMNVAGRGILRQLEDSWNKDGRLFIGHMADVIVGLESGFLPTETLRNHVREYLAGSLYDALKWPRDEQGNPVEWPKLTEADKERIKAEQKSLLDAVKAFRGEKLEEDPLEKVRESLGVAQFLLDHRNDYDPAELLDDAPLSQGDIVYDRITTGNIEAMIKEHGARKVYQKAYMQLEADWNSYSEKAGKLLTDFHKTIGAHIEWADVFREFGEKQMGISGMLAKLAVILGVAGAAVSAIGMRRLARGTGKALQTVSRVPKAVRIMKAGRVAGGAGVVLDAGVVALLLTQKPSTEQEEIEYALEVLTSVHQEGPEKGKLVHPNEFPLYRAQFAAILRERLEIVRLRDLLESIADDLRKKNADPNLLKRVEAMVAVGNGLNNRLYSKFKLAKNSEQRRVFGTTRGVEIPTINRDEWRTIQQDAAQGLLNPDPLQSGRDSLYDDVEQFNDDVMTLLREGGYLREEM